MIYLTHDACMCPDCTTTKTDMRNAGYIVPAGFPETRGGLTMPPWFLEQLMALPDRQQIPDDASQYVWPGVTS